MGKSELQLEIEKEKTKRERIRRDAEIIRDSRWGKIGVVGALLLLTAGIIISLLRG